MLKKIKKVKKPMSAEARKNISEAVKAAAKRKREEMGLPPVGAPRQRVKPLELVKMKDQHFDPNLFVPMRTGKGIDKLFTEEGGIPKATNYMVVGDPGVGKSTVIIKLEEDLPEIPVVYISPTAITYREDVSNVFNFLRSISPCIAILEDLDGSELKIGKPFKRFQDPPNEEEKFNNPLIMAKANYRLEWEDKNIENKKTPDELLNDMYLQQEVTESLKNVLVC
jgi:hypothetical protein